MVKTSYALGIDKEILPKTFTDTIPRSTSQNWKNINPQDFVGNEFAEKVEANLDQVKLMLDERLKKMRLVFYSFGRLYLSILNFIGKDNFRKLILQNKSTVMDLFENLPMECDINIICHLLHITPHQLRVWKYYRSFLCVESIVGYCRKRFPNQISQKEHNTLKSLMSRKRFESWSIASIWGYALKKGFISMSRTSWYRYCLRLGISIKRKRYTKQRKRHSVRASKPNQIWHMDVSQFATTDNLKFYIYTVLDNFSRKILAWNVSRELSAKTRLVSVKEAIHKQFSSELSQQELDLIVDGGSENNNFRINNFIRHCQVDIHKKIALKEVRFSNSMIEGSFKILKKHLRSRGEIHSTNLGKELEFFFKDYNEIRPHYHHWIHTPDEIHNNPELIQVKPHLSDIKKERMQANRVSCCKMI